MAERVKEREELYRVRGLTMDYLVGEVTVRALRGIDLTLYTGESGGEQQRVAMARALAKRPEVLFCDEPTGALDISTGKIVLEQLDAINRDTGTTVVIITHNAAISRMADRVVRMRDGRVSEIIENPSPADVESIEW